MTAGLGRPGPLASGLPEQQCSKTAALRTWALPVMQSCQHAHLKTPTLHARQALVHSQEVHGKEGCLLAPRTGTDLQGQCSWHCIMEEAATQSHVRYWELRWTVLQAPKRTRGTRCIARQEYYHARES